ncbi:hypothetical protein [Comamonas sediminis]|uniref:Uncharacterized protein n=1 Tax=Comamonas sediminis TaxID=1783360 RepID=A0ABV4B2D5_9BURK
MREESKAFLRQSRLRLLKGVTWDKAIHPASSFGSGAYLSANPNPIPISTPTFWHTVKVMFFVSGDSLFQQDAGDNPHVKFAAVKPVKSQQVAVSDEG